MHDFISCGKIFANFVGFNQAIKKESRIKDMLPLRWHWHISFSKRNHINQFDLKNKIGCAISVFAFSSILSNYSYSFGRRSHWIQFRKGTMQGSRSLTQIGKVVLENIAPQHFCPTDFCVLLCIPFKEKIVPIKIICTLLQEWSYI